MSNKSIKDLMHLKYNVKHQGPQDHRLGHSQAADYIVMTVTGYCYSLFYFMHLSKRGFQI